MCGIVGYKGKKEKASELVYNGLKKLEYRGYDSAGIAVASNPTVKLQKGEGTIDNVHKAHHQGDTAVGHTRWATHGGVNDTNAHPHTCCQNEIAVVHNGIIENHQELKNQLSHHEFQSETDTEVIPHLIEEHQQKGHTTLEACQKTIEKLEGSYAVAVLTEDQELIAFKQNSPLVIGIADHGHFIASDVTPFLKHTEKAKYLKDGDLAIITQEKHEIINQGQKTQRKQEKIEWDHNQATKKDEKHYMLKEIKEQPKTIRKAALQDKTKIEKARKMIEKAETVYLTGCGTSSFAADLGAKYLRQDQINTRSEMSHELEYQSENITENDLIIAITQSGETADLTSLIKSTNDETPLLTITNTKGSTLDRKSDQTIYMNAGPEIGVASTKAFTSTLTILKLLQYSLQKEREQGRKTLIETAKKAEKVLEDNKETIDKLSTEMSKKDDLYFIGRNKGYEMAKEADLKFKELTYIHSESFPGGEFKHGNISLVEEGTHLVSFVKEDGHDEIVSNTIEAQSRGAEVIGVNSKNLDIFDQHIWIPEDPNQEILEIIPFQLLAYETSLKLGNNPDRPRNLAKSVTVK